MSQIFTDAAAWEEPPTEYTDITEPTAENILPQIPLSTDANFRGCTCLRSALPLARARSAPTEQYWYTSYFVFVYMICIVACCVGFHLRYGWVRTLTICANQWNLWENITARRFCEFCEICGKKTACLVGAAETTKQAVFFPQISQNSQNLLAVIFSHRFHWFAQIVRVRTHP